MTAPEKKIVGFDFDELNAGEIMDFEALTGKDIDDVAGKKMNFTCVAVFTFLLERRDDPKLTFDAIKALSVDELNERIEKHAARPTEAASAES